jgi:hypothetical protein
VGISAAATAARAAIIKSFMTIFALPSHESKWYIDYYTQVYRFVDVHVYTVAKKFNKGRICVSGTVEASVLYIYNSKLGGRQVVAKPSVVADNTTMVRQINLSRDQDTA